MANKIKSLYKFLSPKYQKVYLEYKVNTQPRYGYDKARHKILGDIIDRSKHVYKENLNYFLQYSENYLTIELDQIKSDNINPYWKNGFLPGLDIIGVYGIIAKYKPLNYIEIGSGNSTKVARKSIIENGLSTKITSIDPYPRAEIDHLSDNVIRKPFEELVDIEFISESLCENDILFIDNSHRVFPNSDAMICFLELLPALKKGVIVHIHDIYLPYDYPQFMCDRFYNEQYTLAAFVIANPDKYQPILPNFFISQDPELSSILKPLWEHPKLLGVEQHGDRSG